MKYASRKAFVIALGLLLGVTFVVAALIASRDRGEAPSVQTVAPVTPLTADPAAILAAIEGRERHMEETLWAPEMLAQECGRLIENLWDAINRSSNKLETLAAFDPGDLRIGNWASHEELPHEIFVQRSSGAGRVIASSEWRTFVERFREAGWQLQEIEFRHNQFQTNSAGGPGQGTFWFSAHVRNANDQTRAIIDGDIKVKWGTKGAEQYEIQQIDATRLVLKMRTGAPLFRRIFSEVVEPFENTRLIDPLLVHDLDGDGFSEIILAGRNLLYRRGSDDAFVSSDLCRYPIDHLGAAVLGDFDGDGAVDLLGAKYEGIFLSKGSREGTFVERPRKVWAGEPLQQAAVITTGDVDRDGDLDLFVAQYREPYEGGVTPTPFYDANDGHPAFLLLNDGRGTFSDATPGSGIEKKRSRRTYSASFVDLNSDSHLDLVVVSDFAGLEIYRNEGGGRFTPFASEWLPEWRAFGMAHSFADFNSDGFLDILMTGMTSPTVERLDHLGLWRAEEFRGMRTTMTAGNRLYLRRETGGFEETALSQSIARSGWSWGCAALDFDNDGFQDVCIVNGMESNASVRDYESEPWLHDYHVGSGTDSAAQDLYFKSKFSRTRGRDYSYGGYEKNRFFWNREGQSFIDIGYLLDLALPEDCRSVVAEDLDRDGRIDLIITTAEFWPVRKQTISIYRNELPESGNWIAMELGKPASARTIGATVRITTGEQRQVQTIINGDSYRSQSSGTIHFGIGRARQVDQLHITWPNRIEESVSGLEANRYHQFPRTP